MSEPVILSTPFNETLTKYVRSLTDEIDQVDADRKERLKEIGDFVVQQLKENGLSELVVICTHNSRRSHIGQAWIQAAALYYGVDGIRAYSGGTEATAFNPNAVAALQRAGFEISAGDGNNPHYDVRAGGEQWTHYSKEYTDEANPKSGFGAIMVCSEADEACPMVVGAADRFTLPFEDPKNSDGSDSESIAYDKAAKEIGREVFFLLNYIKEKSA